MGNTNEIPGRASAPVSRPSKAVIEVPRVPVLVSKPRVVPPILLPIDYSRRPIILQPLLGVEEQEPLIKTTKRKIKNIFDTDSEEDEELPPVNDEGCSTGCTENFQLLPHQCRVAQALQKQRGVIAIHSVGSGKTRVAVSSAKCFLTANPKGLIVVITPNTSIKQNFEKQLIDLENLVPAIPAYASFKDRLFQGESKADRLEELKKSGLSNNKSIFVITEGFITSEASKKFKKDLSRRTYMLIVDEAHNARNTESHIYEELYKLSKGAAKILLLSATPLVNSPLDIIPLLGLINEKAFEAFFYFTEPRTAGTPPTIKFKAPFKPEQPLKLDYFALLMRLGEFAKCIVSVYQIGGGDLLGYPQTKVLEQYFTMDKTQQEKYESIEPFVASGEEVGNMFYTATRAAGFGLLNARGENQKLEYVKALLNSMKEDKDKKIVLYSFYVKNENSLINQVKKYFKNDTAKYGEIWGDMDAEERKQAVKDYNTGVKRVLLISAAGSEGIDLKFTTDIVISEPDWNEASNIQIIGRGVRNKSHGGPHTAATRPTVTAHKLFLIKDSDVDYIFKAKNDPDVRNPAKGIDGKDHKISADLWLKLTADQKQVNNNVFLKELMQFSIEKIPDCTNLPDLTELAINEPEKVSVEYFKNGEVLKYVNNNLMSAKKRKANEELQPIFRQPSSYEDDLARAIQESLASSSSKIVQQPLILALPDEEFKQKISTIIPGSYNWVDQLPSKTTWKTLFETLLSKGPYTMDARVDYLKQQGAILASKKRK
jgi:superfamily II DNA or RNA helicase